METERETMELTTPQGKHKVIMYSYITGYETREIRKQGFGEMEDREKAEDVMIKVLVISINGSDKNILNKILKMRGKDYSYIISKAIDVIKNDFLDQAENIKKEK